MATFIARELSGWARFPKENCQVARPEKRRELLDTIQSTEVNSVLLRGLGRSYGDAALNAEEGVVFTEKLGRFLAFDPQTRVLHAEAGTSFADIIETFVPRGFFLPVAPGTKHITLGGAIACDVHGKNHHGAGCISQHLEEIELLTGRGEVVTCSRESNSEIYWATVGGMGLTGAILSAKLRLMPIESSLIAASYKRTRGIEESLEELSKEPRSTYPVAWIDCLASGAVLGRSVVMHGEHIGKENAPKADPLEFATPKKKAVPIEFPNQALNPLTVKVFNQLYYNAHPDAQKIVDFEPFFWPLDAVAGWNKIYGARGFVQYQFAIPFETASVGLVKILEKISSSGRAPFLAVLKIMGEADKSPLSFPLAGYSLALDLPFTEGVVEFCRELDQLVVQYGGRCYLAKDATLEPATVRQMYPRLPEFEAIKRELDPDNRFQSSLSRRLQIATA